jgi:hypothetical protein
MGSYVKLSEQFYYGRHPAASPPDAALRITHYVDLVQHGVVADGGLSPFVPDDAGATVAHFPIRDRGTLPVGDIRLIVRHVVRQVGARPRARSRARPPAPAHLYVCPQAD